MVKNKRIDVRVQRTYRKLAAGMIDLLSKEMVENISVLDICNASGVHRATFYKHFEDKNDFLKFLFEKLLNDLPYEQLCSNASTEDSYKAYMDVALEVIKFVQEHRALINNVIDTSQSQMFISMFTDCVSRLLENIIVLRAENNIAVMQKRKIPMYANFYASAVVGLIRWWVVNGDTYKESDIKEFVNECFNNMIKLKSI